MNSLAPGGISVIEATAGQTWATVLLLAASRSSASVLVLAPEPSVLVPVVVSDLICAPDYAVGAVVPAVVDHDGPRLATLPVRRDVAGTTFPWLAVRRELVAFLGIDPAADDLQAIIDEAIRAIAARRLRIVSEPSWRVTVPGTARPLGPRPFALDSDPTILVVSGFVPGDEYRAEDRSLRALITDLAEQAEDSRVTFAAADGFRAHGAARSLGEIGVEVIHPPVDWRDWFTGNLARFSHVFVTWSGLQSDLGRWIRGTQPQAVKVLFLPGLAFRDIEALRPYTPDDEIEGLESVRVASMARLSELAISFDAAWCEREVDASYLRGQHPDLTVCVVPPALGHRSHGARARPPDQHPSVVILASEGHDVIKANEEAAAFSLTNLLPLLRRDHRDLVCTVLSEAPTPRLVSLCEAHDSRLASFDPSPTALDQARLVLVGHQHGTGGQVSVLTALEARIPFVTTPVGAQGVPLGDLAPLAVCSTLPDLVVRGRRLLGDQRSRARFLAGIDRLRSGPMARSRRMMALRAALPRVGLAPSVRTSRSWPSPRRRQPPRPPLAFTRLRPEGYVGEPPGSGPEPQTETDRYREWLRRFAANQMTLDHLRADIDAAAYQPLVSVLLLVSDSDPVWLTETIASVTSQIYERWQLCIVDNGSQRAETLAVLHDVNGHPAIETTHLPHRVPTAAAMNVALASAGGEFVTFVEDDGVLRPHALAQVVRWLNADRSLDIVYSDEDESDHQGSAVNPQLKPDWSPDRLLAHDYIGHLTVLRRVLVEQLDGMRPAFDGDHHYDLMLRASEVTNRIAHIPEPLYTGRMQDHGPAPASPDGAAKRALVDALARRGTKGSIEDTAWRGLYRTRYALVGAPRVAIVIPTKDGVGLLRRCIGSILEKSTYRNYELVIIDNETSDGDTLGYLASLPARVIRYPHRFNYSRMLNLAVTTTDCDALLFLNNDTEVITPEWIEALLEHAMRPEVGAVGARLYFGDGRVQHEGILMGGWAWNLDHQGYRHLGEMVRNVSAVTGACTMVRPSVYGRVGGNDERLRVAFNDVDICMRIRQAGFEVIYTPHAELFHYESSTRSFQEHAEDSPLFNRRWEPRRRVDPYHSPLYQRDQFFRIDLVDKYE